MIYIRKEVDSENADGTLMVRDHVMQLVPTTAYDNQHVVQLIVPRQNKHIVDFKTVMKNFDVEVVS
jgi:hypothetical protein